MLTKKDALEVQELVQQALVPVAQELGYSFSVLAPRWTRGWLAMPLLFFRQDEGEREGLRKFTGLEYGMEFEHKGKRLVLVGVTSRARKYPLLVEDASGQRFRMGVEVVRRAIRGKGVAR